MDNNIENNDVDFSCPVCGSTNISFLTVWREGAPEIRCMECGEEGTMKEFSTQGKDDKANDQKT